MPTITLAGIDSDILGKLYERINLQSAYGYGWPDRIDIGDDEYVRLRLALEDYMHYECGVDRDDPIHRQPCLMLWGIPVHRVEAPHYFALQYREATP